MSTINSLRFIQPESGEKEVLSFRVTRRTKLEPDHPYFEKGTYWSIVKWEDTEDYPYEAMAEDRRNGIRYTEIFEQILDEVNGIPNTKVYETINLESCFAFDYAPSEGDILRIWSAYRYDEVKNVPRSYHSQFKYMAFTFTNGYWEIDTEIIKRIVKKAICGIVEVI